MDFSTCARQDCDERFETRKGKHYHSDRCRRIVANRRYRARHTETATCKACGRSFTRSKVSKRKKVYCSLECQAESRSKEYRERPDIQAQVAEMRRRRERVWQAAKSAPPPKPAEPEPPRDPATAKFYDDDSIAADLREPGSGQWSGRGWLS